MTNERQERRGQGLKGKTAYTNGEKTLWLRSNDPIPNGFVKGRKSCMTPELRQQLSNKVHELWQDEEYRRRQTEAHLGNEGTTAGKISITNGVVDKYVYPEELPDYIGWRVGSKKRGTPLTCDVWNKGLTKDTDERVARNGRAIAIALLGNIPWNKGLTAATDERVRRMAEKQVGKVISAEQRHQLSIANTGRKQSNAEKEKRAKSLEVYWRNNPEKLAARNKKLKLHYADPKVRKECSERSKQNIERDPTIITRGIETKRQRHTFRVSTPEKEFYHYLLTIFDEQDIFTQYKDEARYPFHCDFYIKSKDLFIELNIHPTHGEHPFDPESIEDILLLSELEKQDNQWSKNIVDVWTIRDYNKIQMAKENNINYMVIYEHDYRTKNYRID